MAEWVSHLDRSQWPPEVLAEVEAAEERMRRAVAAAVAKREDQRANAQEPRRRVRSRPSTRG